MKTNRAAFHVFPLVLSVSVLSGCGLWPSPSELDFDKTYINTSTKMSASWNNSGKKAVDILGFRVRGDAEFQIGAGSYTGGNVAVNGATGRVNVVFTPVEAKAYSGKVEALANGPKTDLRLSGRGVVKINEGDLYIDDFSNVGHLQPVDFGQVPVGATAVRTFRITNVSATRDITYSVTWAENNPAFTLVSPTAPFRLKKGESVQCQMTFKPSAVGWHFDGITFTDTSDLTNRSGAGVRGQGVAG
jgi:hypothetical protein